MERLSFPPFFNMENYMKSVQKLFIILLLLLFTASTGLAGQSASESDINDFENFAMGWVGKLNRSHIKSYDKMEIILQPDGNYLARYHSINPETVKCIVKSTSSKRKGLVGLLKYIETIYESTAATPQEARKKTFKAVKNIRITEIFSNTGKGWR